MDTRRSSGYKKKEQIQEEELGTIQREGLYKRLRNGYKEFEWIQREGMDSR